MKLLTNIVAFLFLSLATTVQAQTNDLGQFVKKFDQFTESETARLRWTKSPDLPENATQAVPMPNAIDATITHVPDPESGLWHYPNLGKVYDPETGYYIDYDAHRYYLYRADTTSGEIFKGSDEVQIKRTDKVQK